MCACVHWDAYHCWAYRYDIDLSEVSDDGGPCECECHKEDEDDDEYDD